MKKAQIFDVSMVFVVLGAMIGVLLVINSVASQTSNWKIIGQRAFELQNSYTEADYAVAFMSSSARWAAPKTIEWLGDNGGFIQLPCGSSKAFALWNDQNNPKTTCFPNAYENFYSHLGVEMSSYVKLYAQPKIIDFEGKQFKVSVKPFDIPYEYVVIGNRLLGIATAPLFINVLAPSENLRPDIPLDFTGLWSTAYTQTFDAYYTGTYVYRPNFEIPFSYNLDVYNALEGAVAEIVKDCPALPSDTEKIACAKPKIEKALDASGDTKRTIDITSDSDIFYFTISQDSRKTVYLDNNAPEIKFALALPAPKPVSIASIP
jgi:hypothetical protein